MKRVLLSLTLMLAVFPKGGDAQTPYYQSKTITITVGYQPGDGYDIWARLLAAHIVGHSRCRAREICLRENAKAMLTGSIAALGSHYVITLSAVNAQTGDTIASEQAESDSKEQVLKSLDKAATSLRGKMGESLPSERWGS